MQPRLHAGIAEVIARSFAGAVVVETKPLAAGIDSDASAATKVAGYGEPVRIRLRERDGRMRDVVWHTARSDVFGHDRRADRVDEMLLAFDTFNTIPGHVRALDVGVIDADGRVVSLAGAGEAYLVTEWGPGRPYAEDLQHIVEARAVGPLDEKRCVALARYLAALHKTHIDDPPRHRRSVRDLVGHGEGIFGIIDGYPENTPAAPPARLRAIEQLAVDWRWQLRQRAHRLARIHGDFHPFNVLFDDDSKLALVDASRGCAGDPADDVTAMAVNYVFFALAEPAAWPALRTLWRRFLEVYLEETGDAELLEVAAPYIAWRGLVVSNPRFYPDLPVPARDRMLSWIERVLVMRRFNIGSPDDIFT